MSTSTSFSEHLDLPSRQVGVLLASELVGEQRNYETEFDQEWRTVTLTSESQHGLNRAKAKMRTLIEQISRGITTRMEYLHPSCIPLLSAPWGRSAIASIEELYHVEMSFTVNHLPLAELSRIVHEVALSRNVTTLYLVEHFRDLLVPVSPTGEAITTASSAVWSYRNPGGNFSPFLLIESSALEQLFQYGGHQVTLSGQLCTVNFREMTVVGDTGQTTSLQRIPPLGLPEQRLVLNVKGLELYVANALSNLKERLRKDMQSSNILLNSIGRPVSSHLQQQISNVCRQYCIEFNFDSTILHIRGCKEYVDQLLPLLQAFVGRLDATPQSPPQQLAAVPVPAPTIAPIVHQRIVPPTWTEQSNRCEILPVAQGSLEWNELCSMIRATFHTINILQLDRIQNLTVWEKYQLEGSQMSERNSGATNEKLLFHGTNTTDPYSIARSESGIDFRYSRQDGRLLWGTGAYFAEKASYSDHYSYKLADGRRQMMIVSVLAGIAHNYRSNRNPSLTRPPEREPGRLYDTVRGFAGQSDIYVVYDHAKSCPAYIITYTNHQPSS